MPNGNGNGKHHLKKVRIDDLLTFSPITTNQEKTFQAYHNNKHLLLHGIAGTGKTFMSLYLALEEVLDPQMFTTMCLLSGQSYQLVTSDFCLVMSKKKFLYTKHPIGLYVESFSG